MNEREALLGAICANPDDDTLRLAFADYLDENGTADDRIRAAFIRAQVRLATLPREAPEWTALYGEIERRWRGHMDRWRRALPVLPGISWGEFKRGFVKTATADNAAAFVRNGARAIAHAPVTALHFKSREGFGLLAKCEAFRRVRKLSFGGSGELSRLKEIELCGVLASPNCPRLRVLHLDGEGLGPVAASALAHCPHLTALTKLVLFNNRIEDIGMVALAMSPHLAKLRVLNAHTNNIGDAGIEALANATSLGGLTNLHVGDQIGSDSARALAASPYLSNLTELTLSRHNIGAEGVRVLVGSPNCAKLNALMLQGWYDGNGLIGADGAVAIAESPHLGALRELLLMSAGVGDAGAGALANSPTLANLNGLNLTANGITDVGALALANSPHLTRLRPRGLCLVDNNGITEAGRQALRYRFDPPGEGHDGAVPF